MRKEIFIHLSATVSLIVFVSLFKGWVDISYWQLWLGALLGTFLPDLDHLVYIYFLRPYELTSQRVGSLVAGRNFSGALSLLYTTRSERGKLVFHTVIFQLIFFALSFMILTSSGSLLGRGIVLAVLLHLVVDQLVDWLNTNLLTNWFRDVPFSFNQSQQKVYLLAASLLTLGFAFLF